MYHKNEHSLKAKQRLEKHLNPTTKNWEFPKGPQAEGMSTGVALECGWGRLIFAHTFANNDLLAENLLKETPGKRDIAFYVRDPHVILAKSPQNLFLDPSHTYRLWFANYHPGKAYRKNFIIRKIQAKEDVNAINRIYLQRKMVAADGHFLWQHRNDRKIVYLVAEDSNSKEIIGTVTGIDHKQAFSDPENGSSLWCLAVDPNSRLPGVGEALVRHLIEYFWTQRREYLDLSVLHENDTAIALYEKLGFQRVPVFCIKTKNIINEHLFTEPSITAGLNPYAQIIVDAAEKRGIQVELLDAANGYFRLSFGGRSVTCRESLTELSDSIAMSRCSDKCVTLNLMKEAGLRVPRQVLAASEEENRNFLQLCRNIVVKPRHGEQGSGISVGVSDYEDMKKAIALARKTCSEVILEEYLAGSDLRVVVIGDKVAAAAVRKPPYIVGDGKHNIKTLIQKLSRRRSAATGGESRVPLDKETERFIKLKGFQYQDILPPGQELQVRGTANLHTGGTIHDVTLELSAKIKEAALLASQALNIPVVGLDFIVPEVGGDEYAIIEANERPGLANHEPQPLPDIFLDFLFPRSHSKIRKVSLLESSDN